MKEVVHTETLEQYDYVLSKIENKNNLDDLNYTKYNCDTCINLDTDCYGNLQHYTKEGYKIISFNEFKSRYEPQLKIGDTFEYNGFVCEVKEEIKKWYKVEDNISNKVAFEKLYKQDVLDIEKLPYAKLTEITNKEFIKQLEENAR